MSRRQTVGVVAVAVLFLGIMLVAVVAQEQPQAKVAAPDDVKALRRAAAGEKEQLKGDPQVQLASLIARSLAAQPAIAVAGEHVYVVKGNVLYQFAVDGLKLVAKAELEAAAPEAKARRDEANPRKTREAPAAAP